MFGYGKKPTPEEMAKAQSDLDVIHAGAVNIAKGGDDKLYNLFLTNGQVMLVKLPVSFHDFLNTLDQLKYVRVATHGGAPDGSEIFVPMAVFPKHIIAVAIAPIVINQHQEDAPGALAPQPLFHEDEDGNIVHTDSGQVVGHKDSGVDAKIMTDLNTGTKLN